MLISSLHPLQNDGKRRFFKIFDEQMQSLFSYWTPHREKERRNEPRYAFISDLFSLDADKGSPLLSVDRPEDAIDLVGSRRLSVGCEVCSYRIQTYGACS